MKNQKKKEKIMHVGIEWYVDDPEPRINEVIVFRKKPDAEEWQTQSHSREIHEAELK